MANCTSSSWSEETLWVQGQAALGKGTSCLVPWQAPSESSLFQFQGYPCWPDGVEEDRAVSASKSHSLAEKRRRDRINSQLATLRKLIPRSDKMDKAALLGSVVEHVKDLKRKALEVGKMFTVPTDVDEVTIIDCNNSGSEQNSSSKDNLLFIEASVCCDDRPELLSELNQAINGLSLTTVKADMTSLGGRMKGIFVLCTNESRVGVDMNSLKQSLKLVLTRIATSSTSNYTIKSKRQRFFFPSN
ncbi:hypothetical protein LguiA_023800 [Lonicera macranthoides]